MIVVRAIEERDRAAWQPLWRDYNAFYGRSGMTALDNAITETTWHRFFDAGEPVFAKVAEREGGVIGIVHYLLHRSTTAIADVCYLQDLLTLESERGTGVGRALIEAVYAEAEQHGCPRVYWQTHESNATARRLYDRVADASGFIVYRNDLTAPASTTPPQPE